MVVNYTDLKILNKILEENFTPDKDIFTKNEVLEILHYFSEADKYLYKTQEKSTAYRNFKYFVRYCLYRNMANFDSCILLTGDKGAGKSSFAVMLTREWCRLLGLPLKLDKIFVYTNKQLTNAIDSIPRFYPLVADESANFAMAENWAKLENKELKRKLAKVRTRHLFYILCFPMKVYKVDKVYLESYVNYWIDLFGRGKGALFVKDRNPVNEAWRLRDFEKLGSYTEFNDSDFVDRKLRRHPNFWMMLTAPKPPEKLYNRYLVIREKNIYHSAEESAIVTKQDIYRALLIKTLRDIITKDNSISIKKIATHIKIETGYHIPEKTIKEIIDESCDMIEKIDINEAKDEKKLKRAEQMAINRG